MAKRWSGLRSVWGSFGRHKKKDSVPPEEFSFSKSQKRALVIAVIIALLVGFVLVRKFATVIVLSGILAYLFYPTYLRLERRMNRPGTAALLTVLYALVIIIIPLIITVVITVGQINHLINQLSTANGGSLSLNDAGKKLLDTINHILETITGGTYQISAAQLQSFFAKVASSLVNFLLNALSSSFSGIANLVTQFILFLYIFTSMLTQAPELVKIFKALNPLGDELSTLYLNRSGGMIKGTVKGQFIIAICQGIAAATFLQIAGLHYFFFFALILTILSIIPLGAGIIVIPIGIIMLLTGNYWQGAFVLLTHFLLTTNIDNVLRPVLVPKSVRINSALMMLAVFGGLGLFGFLGIVIGPVIMILVLTTIQVYMPFAEADKSAAIDS